MRVKDFIDKLNAQISEMGLEEAELTALGRGFDDEKGSYFLVMAKPTAESRDVEIRCYNSEEKEKAAEAELTEKETQKRKRTSIEYGD